MKERKTKKNSKTERERRRKTGRERKMKLSGKKEIMRGRNT